MSETKTYSGSCHCGKVRFEMTAEITRASACNCSTCGRLGWLMVSVPPGQFKLQSGTDAQTDYQFGKVIVNLRCVEGLDVDALEVEKFDGRSY